MIFNYCSVQCKRRVKIALIQYYMQCWMNVCSVTWLAVLWLKSQTECKFLLTDVFCFNAHFVSQLFKFLPLWCHQSNDQLSIEPCFPRYIEYKSLLTFSLGLLVCSNFETVVPFKVYTIIIWWYMIWYDMIWYDILLWQFSTIWRAVGFTIKSYIQTPRYNVVETSEL